MNEYFMDLQLYVESLCHGNLSENEAVKLSEIFISTLSGKPLPDESKHHEKVVCLAPGAVLLRSVPVKNELEVNSVVEVSLPPPPSSLSLSLSLSFSLISMFVCINVKTYGFYLLAVVLSTGARERKRNVQIEINS
jgi:hypothetical protein